MRKYWWLLVLPAALLLWWGVGRGESAAQIHFSTARYATGASTVPTNGKVEPAEWSAATAETGGVVRSVAVRRGQRVQAGQPLITLDTTAANSDLAASLAREREAQPQLHSLNQGANAAAVADLEDRIRTARAAVA